MTKLQKKRLCTGTVVMTLIVFAVLARVISKLGYLPTTFSLIRTMIYIGIYIAWGFSVKRRVVQVQPRRCLVFISLLMFIWFIVRSMKYFLVTDPTGKRYLWYLYYLPMLFIPLFSLFVSFSLGKPESHRPPRWQLLLFIPTALCLLFVLTNDLHQLVFTFPADEIWSDTNCGYSFGYYIVISWEILCALTAFAVMIHKCRLLQRRKYLPAIPLICSIIYAFIYVSGVRWMQLIGGDITAVQCLMFTLTLECCIQCGLIQTNTGYDELFEVSSLGAQITNEENVVCLTSVHTMDLTEEQRKTAFLYPTIIDKSVFIKSHPIRFGHVLWQEDVTEMIEANEEIKENNDNLAKHNLIDRENLETKKEDTCFKRTEPCKRFCGKGNG